MDDITNSMDMSLNKPWEIVKSGEHCYAAIHGFTELNKTKRLNRTEGKVQDFPAGPVVKNVPASTGGMGSVTGPGRSHRLQSN